MRSILAGLLVAGCASPVGEKAESIVGYCLSGPAQLAASTAHFRDRMGLPEANAWASARHEHADYLKTAPQREVDAMRAVVRFVYANPGLDADEAAAVAFGDCVRARKEGTWFKS